MHHSRLRSCATFWTQGGASSTRARITLRRSSPAAGRAPIQLGAGTLWPTGRTTETLRERFSGVVFVPGLDGSSRARRAE